MAERNWADLADEHYTDEEVALAESFFAFQKARYEAGEIPGYATSYPAFIAGLRAGQEQERGSE